jgi:hypothetical protein
VGCALTPTTQDASRTNEMMKRGQNKVIEDGNMQGERRYYQIANREPN